MKPKTHNEKNCYFVIFGLDVKVWAFRRIHLLLPAQHTVLLHAEKWWNDLSRDTLTSHIKSPLAETSRGNNWPKLIQMLTCWRSKIWCGEKWFTDSWVTGQTRHTRSTEIVTLTAWSSEFFGRLFRSNQNDMWQYLAWWCSGSALDMMKSRVCSESCSPTSSVPLSPSCSAQIFFLSLDFDLISSAPRQRTPSSSMGVPWWRSARNSGHHLSIYLLVKLWVK